MNHQQVKLLGEKYAKVRKHLLPALELCGGTHNEADLWNGLQSEKMQLWPGKESAIVTEVIEYPRLRACHFWLVGGDMDEVLEMEPEIVAWAKSSGCKKITASGRRGWERQLKHWKLQSVNITRDV